MAESSMDDREVAAARFPAAETMVGDLADWVVSEMAALSQPLQMMSPDGRDRLKNRLLQRAEAIVGRVVSLAAGELGPAVAVRVESITVKKAVKVTVTIEKDDPGVEQLVEGVGRMARIVIAPEVVELGGAEPDGQQRIPGA